MALIIVLAALPVALTATISILADEIPEDFTEFMLDGMIVAVIMPITVMALATASFGNELEDRTLSYLVLKPIPRWQIVAPKFLTVLFIGGPFMVASGVIAAFLGFNGDLQVVTAVGTAIAVGVVTYAAIFTWAGLISSRALAFALVYVFLWEGLIASFLSGIRFISVRSYTISVMHGLSGDKLASLEQFSIQLPVALVGAALMTALFLLLTVRRLRRMDVP